MVFMNRRWVAFAVVAGAGVSMLWRMRQWLYSKRYQRNSKRNLMKVLFFPDSQVSCRTHFTERHGCTSQRCRFSHDPENAYAQLLQ